MKTRKFGTLEISAVGLGCMGFTHGYGTCPNEEESIRLKAVPSSIRLKYTVVIRMKNSWERH